jgi:hypothetical protein
MYLSKNTIFVHIHHCFIKFVCMTLSGCWELLRFISYWKLPRHILQGNVGDLPFYTEYRILPIPLRLVCSICSLSGGPGSSPGLVKWDLWTKWRWGRFSPITPVSLANLHSTKFCILTITRGKYNRPEVADVPSGPSMDSNPQYAN